MTNSFWVPKFRLSPDRKEKIAELIGYEHVECIESACRLYLGFKTTPKPTTKRVRQRHLWRIKKALEDSFVRDDARVLLGEKWVEYKLPWYIFDEALDVFFQAFKEIEEPPERGAVTGEKKKPHERFLAWRLYECCIKAGITPVKNSGGEENSILHKILDELREPLGLKDGPKRNRTMNGILNEVIREGKKGWGVE